MAIFTRDDVGHQAEHWLIHDQGLARQRCCLDIPEGFETTFSGFDAVAINDFDAVALEPGGALSTHGLDQGSKFSGAIANQF